MLECWNDGVNASFQYSSIPSFHAFKWQPVFSIGVALLAARHKISFGGFTASYKRNQMIHREISRRKLTAAMMANPRAALALPPLARAQLAGLLPFPADLFFADLD